MSPLSIGDPWCRRGPTGGVPLSSRLCRPAAPPVPQVITISDALVRVKVVFIDNFSSGRAQSLGGGTTTRPLGRYMFVAGTVEFSETGGRDGGGCVTAIGGDVTLGVQTPTAEGEDHGNADYAGLLGPGEAERFQGAASTCHKLNGLTFDEPKVLQHLGAHMKVLLMPDRTIRVGVGAGAPFTLVGAATTYTVPADDWFVIEGQGSIAPQFYDRGGFMLANLYTEDGVAFGDPVARAIGVNTAGGTFNSAFGAGIPEGTSLCMHVLGNPFGEEKRWLYDVLSAPAAPVADGDTVDSFINYEHIEDIGLMPDGITPQPVGMNLVWGASARYLNVLDKNRSCLASVDELTSGTFIGAQSLSTGIWVGGPFYPPTPDSQTRNQIRNSGLDLYSVRLARSGVVQLEAIAPFALVGVRTIRGAGANLAEAPVLQYTGPHPNQIDDDLGQFVYGTAHSYYRLVTKAGGILTLGRPGVALVPPNFSEWRAHAGYTISPDSVIDARAIDPADLPQVGLLGDFTKLDAIDPAIPGARRWIMVDIGQIGLDVLYRKRIVQAAPPPDRNPIAFFKQSGGNLALGLASIYDLSVDFNGDYDSLITGVVTRSIAWGDGNTELIGPGVVAGVITPVTHQYAGFGTYTIELTVTNTAGLTATYSVDVVVPVSALVCVFSAEFDDDDLDRLTLNFTDESTTDTTTIVSETWAFGDGGTSTASNPSHTYAAAGTYTVVHTVTDNAGQTSSTSADLTVPDVVPVSGCGLSATAIANGVNIQGDDFAGGNPPLPAWVNTAAFAAVAFNSSPYRGFYDIFYPSQNDGNDFIIDTVKTFNSRNTLKTRYGSGAAPFGFSQGGQSCRISDDGSPVETFPATNSPTPKSCWSRTIISIDPGLAATLAGTVGIFSGFELITHSGQKLFVSLLIRGGSIWLSMQTHEADFGLNVNFTVDTGVDPATFLQSGFGEAILYTEGDDVAHTLRAKVWLGAACELTGIPSVADHTKPAFDDGVARKLRHADVSFGNAFWTMTATNNYTNVSVSEVQNGKVLADNPFNVDIS